MTEPHVCTGTTTCPLCSSKPEDVGTVGDAVVVATYQRQPVADRLNPGVIVEGPMTDSFMCDTCKGWFSERHGARVPHVQLFGEADCRCDEPKKIITPPVRIDSVTWSHGPEDEPLDVRDGAVVFPDGKVLHVVGEVLHLSPPAPTTSAEQEARAKFYDAAKPHGMLMGVAWSKTTRIPATPAASFAELAGETTDPRAPMSTAHRCACGGWFAVDGGKRVAVIHGDKPIALCECATPKPSSTGERRPNGPPSVASRAEAKDKVGEGADDEQRRQQKAAWLHGKTARGIDEDDYLAKLQAEITDLKGLLAMAKIREAAAEKDKAAVVAAVDDVIVMMSLPERDTTRTFSYPAAPYVRHVLGELVKLSKGLAFDLAIARNAGRPSQGIRERAAQVGAETGVRGFGEPVTSDVFATVNIGANVVEVPNKALGTIHVAAIAPLVVSPATLQRLVERNEAQDVDGVPHYIDDRGVHWPLFVG